MMDSGVSESAGVLTLLSPEAPPSECYAEPFTHASMRLGCMHRTDTLPNRRTNKTSFTSCCRAREHSYTAIIAPDSNRAMHYLSRPA